MKSEVDLVVVGAGPTGLFGAYYAGFRGLSVAVVDSLPEVGGQVSALYPEKLLYDIAGFPAVRGRDLVSGLVEQAERFDPVFLLGARAERAKTSHKGLIIETDTGSALHCKAVLVTAGIGTFSPRPLPAGEKFLGRGLYYFVPKPEDHAGRDVVIVGGGDSALDWALTLEPIARSVTLVHRRERFRAHAHTVDLVEASSVVMCKSAVVHALRGTSTVEAVEILHGPTGAVRTIEAQSVIAALGFVADLGPIERWGVELRKRRIPVDTRMATNLPGVYAAGDVTDYPGKVRLIAVGFGEAATAVNNAAVFIDPSLDLFPGHSSDAV